MDNTKALNVVDLFCGAGGMSAGFEKAGFRISMGIDNDPASIDTFRNNFGKHRAAQVDVKSFPNQRNESCFKKIPHYDLVIGGPPCQGFSMQRRGPEDDPRNELIFEFVRVVSELKPTYFVMENVPSLVSRGHNIHDQMKNRFESAGYGLKQFVLNASNYGVAQRRKRLFIIGGLIKGKKDLYLNEPKKHELTVTVRDKIYDLMDIEPRSEGHPTHICSTPSSLNLKRLKSIKQGQGRNDLPHNLKLETQKNHPKHGHADTYGRMHWDRVSPTLTTGLYNITKGRFGHPELDRPITMLEAARLHGFEDNFKFTGSMTQLSKQIGNAVCPPVAEAIALSIKDSRKILMSDTDQNVFARGKTCKLTRREFKLLKYLYSRKGEIVPWRELLNPKNELATEKQEIYQSINSLKKKIGDDQYGPAFILSFRNKGYGLAKV